MDIIFYLRGDDVAATVVDIRNAKGANPTITRGLEPMLKIRPVHSDGVPFTADELNYAAWDFVMDNDWITTTPPKIRVQSGITVAVVAVSVDGANKDYAEISIPLTDTNTNEIIAALGNNPEKSLGVELAGIPAGTSIPGLIWQFDMSVRNRRGTAGTGTPAPVGDGTYSSSQIDALIAGCEQIHPGTQVALTDDATTNVNIYDKTLAGGADLTFSIIGSSGKRMYNKAKLFHFGEEVQFLCEYGAAGVDWDDEKITISKDMDGDNVRLNIALAAVGENLKLVYTVKQLIKET